MAQRLLDELPTTRSRTRTASEQQQIGSAPDLSVFQSAIYTKGLPDVLDD